MTSTHTAQNTDGIRIAASVGCAAMALVAAVIVVQFFGVVFLGHGVVPAEVFAARAALAVVLPIAAALAIDTVRSLLDTRVRQGFVEALITVLNSFFSAVMAFALPPPRAAL